MRILVDLLNDLPDAGISEVVVGPRWSCVVAGSGKNQRAGLSVALPIAAVEPALPLAANAGERASARALAQFALDEQPALASMGIAAINALLPPRPNDWVELNAEQLIAAHGAGRKVALIGHFNFVPRLRSQVGELFILERRPRPGDLPENCAADVLPDVDVIAITGMSLVNHTLESLLAYCPPRAKVILLGPSAPLSPVLFDYGIDFVCGALVTSIPDVLAIVRQGGDFSQMCRAGVRKVVISLDSALHKKRR
jgi:hypothetical protein